MWRVLLALTAILQCVHAGQFINWVHNHYCPRLNNSEPCDPGRNALQAQEDWKVIYPHDTSQRPVKFQSCSFSSYSALGDSYSVGLGSRQRLEMCPNDMMIASDTCTTDHCGKDIGSYAYRFAKQFGISNFQYLACSGANSSKILNTQVNSKYFNYPASSSTPPALVTLTAGGDDFSLFLDIVLGCVIDSVANGPVCDLALWDANTKKLPKVGANLALLYAGINAKLNTMPPTVPKPQVVVLGMPRPFGTSNYTGAGPNNGFCPAHPNFARRQKINTLVANLNTITKIAALAAGFTFAETDPYWETHRWCDTNAAWLNYNLCRTACDTGGIKYSSVAYAHPFYDGQGAFKTALINALGCTPSIDGAGDAVLELK